MELVLPLSTGDSSPFFGWVVRVNETYFGNARVLDPAQPNRKKGARDGDVVMVVQGIVRVVDRITDQWECVLWSRGVP